MTGIGDTQSATLADTASANGHHVRSGRNPGRSGNRGVHSNPPGSTIDSAAGADLLVPIGGGGMIVGVPRESYPGERRVALVPLVVPGLLKAGLQVVVE